MRHTRLRVAQVVADAVTAAGGLAAAYYLRFEGPIHPAILGGQPPDPQHYQAAGLVAAVVVVGVFLAMGVYRYRRGTEFIDELFSLIGAMAVATLVLTALVGLYREGSFQYSRSTILYWAVVATTLVAIARYAIRRYQARQRKRGRGTDRAVVVGEGAAAGLVIQRMRMFPDYGYQLVGVLADGLEQGAEFGGVQVLGATGDLSRVVRNRDIGVVFIALPELSQDRVLKLMDTCDGSGAEFRIVPSMLELMTTQVTADQLDGIPLLQFRHGLDIAGPKVVIKRVFDFTVALIGMVVLSPVLLLLALLVRASSNGPILIHQQRVGLHNAVFDMHKFRTMRADAEEETGPVWAEAADPRRTTMGRILRRLSLDELPQLWNVLRGEMSLVGPRPERPVFVREFNDQFAQYSDRHQVRPGITGWAQVNDLRGQTPVDERLLYDLYYIENWSLQFDLKILLITLVRVFTHKNAY